jgi:cytochrome b involved in lipid metabolism
VRRFIFAVFVAFLASAATIGILSQLAPQAEEPAAGTARQVSPAELRRHATAKDCWMAIEGGVYDFTGYISAHPTAPDVLAEWCGKEATEPFNTKGYGSPHSAAARAMLPRHFVGALSEK